MTQETMARARALRASGLRWDAVARSVHYSASRVKAVCGPVPLPPAGRPERAAALRAAGLGWWDVARAVGYRDRESAKASVRGWRRRAARV